MLDDFFRADAFPVGEELVALPIRQHDQNLRRTNAARDRAERLRAVGVLLDVGQRTSSRKQVQRQVGLRAVLRPRRAPTDFAVTPVEIHGEFATGNAAVPDWTMLHELARAVDVELVFPAAVATECDRVPDVGFEVAVVHGDGDYDFVDPVVLQRDLRLDVDASVPSGVQM